MSQYIQDLLDSVNQVSMSDSSLEILMEFERVIDSLNLYAFENWKKLELCQGPILTKYRVACSFCVPFSLMPDPAGAERLLPYGIKVSYKKDWLVYPIKIKSEADYRPTVKKAKLARTRIWIITINMPLHLIKDITRGSEEIMDADVDMEDIDQAYDEGLANSDAIVDNDTTNTGEMGNFQ
jgi:hypothetical protein